MRIGIVGHAADKFTVETEEDAREIIRGLFSPGDIVISGGCHLGGIDQWAIEEAKSAGLLTEVYLPRIRSWAGGYRERNMLIARDSDEVRVIVVRDFPEGFGGVRYPFCYHCGTSEHVKSGGCWTGRLAQKLGKRSVWHVIGEEKQ